MNKQQTHSVYHGKWSIPVHNSTDKVIEYKECMGTLAYDGERIRLDVYPDFSLSPIGFEYIEVLYGYTNTGYQFTLFGLNWRNLQFGVSVSFSVTEVILGRKVESLSAPLYDECVVSYPNLRNLIPPKLSKVELGDKTTLEITTEGIAPLFQMEIEEGVVISLCPTNNFNFERFNYTYTEDTKLRIVSNKPISINNFRQIIKRFTQFLSVALYAQQTPISIEFKVSQEDSKVADKLLFGIEKSQEPSMIPLLKYELLKDKFDILLKKWFENYEQIAPICSYLIRSLEKSVYDAPKFLIVAQAVDGYFKRFVNGKDGKNTQQYEHQIQKLLKHFKGVKAIQECSIDAEVMAHSRNKYSHLIPDGETKSVEKAVSGIDLYVLTKKTIVLLTCCILDYIGLTTEEINQCIENSAVENIVYVARRNE